VLPQTPQLVLRGFISKGRGGAGKGGGGDGEGRGRGQGRGGTPAFGLHPLKWNPR